MFFALKSLLKELGKTFCIRRFNEGKQASKHFYTMDARFFLTQHQSGKKYTKLPLNYRMATKYTKWT
jgi:hypothetical protein